MFASIRAAVVQAEQSATLEEALSATRVHAERAADAGAGLIVFPETWIPHYPMWLDICERVNLWDDAAVKRVYARYVTESVVVGGPVTEQLGELARRLQATIVVGVSERVDRGAGRGTLFNALLTFGTDGRLANHHRKLMPTHTERLVWGLGDGDGLTTVDASGARVGGLICWEHWMPLARQAMHEAGEDVHAAVWPQVKEMNHVASRHYAFEGRCFVLAAGSLMRAPVLPPELPIAGERPAPDGLVMHGGSAIIGPDGQYVVPPVYDREEILIATLDLARTAEESMALDVSGHYSRPDCLRLVRESRGRQAAQ
ncbi:MAG TPA: carbon-nitrogen hydrolase family protein [Gemmatimonadaceae bacterium]|nr:carbon-nitrogen hydrolase family protein [Gemmatimonadaceae bacterium]